MLGTPQEVSAQEEEYAFPYHYVTSFGTKGFKQHYVDTWGVNYALAMEFLIEQVRRVQPASLIDIGCGDGRLTRELCELKMISRLCGVDFSSRAISLAHAMNQDRPEASFLSLDITEPHNLGQFDAAVLMEVFEHIPQADCERFISFVRRLIRPGGTLFLTVPHANKVLEYKHFQHFSTRTLRKFIEPHFRVDRVMPFEKAALRRKLLAKLMCNRIYVLNHRRLLEGIYQYHRRALFHCETEAQCQRLYLEATAI